MKLNEEKIILTKTELRHLLGDFIIYCKKESTIDDFKIDQWLKKFIDKR
jgi:hypothetical protein